jgi:hypothetical protein
MSDTLSCPFSARTPTDLLSVWNDRRNFLIGPELFSFDAELPSSEEIVDILRKHPDSRVQFLGMEDGAENNALIEKFKSAPLEQVIDLPFSLANFFLHSFYEPGAFLQNFQRDVMIPWRTFLSSTGLTWQRAYPIFFISGKNCSSTYHVDVSHVVAWQVHGVKVFNGFKDPEDQAAVQHIVDNRNEYRYEMPPGADPERVLTYRMEPGDILWNQLLTPHWVDSENEIAVSINISHGGIAYRQEFCPNEQILRNRWVDHPADAWLVDKRY